MPQTTIAPGAANFVAGEWTAARGGRTYERHNPWRPSEVVGEFPRSSAEDVDAAVAAAAGAFPEWSRLPAAKRGAYPDSGRRRDRFPRGGHRPGHDPRDGQAAARVPRRGGARRRRSSASSRARAGGRSARCTSSPLTGAPCYTRRRPLGVVGLITPWNFPAAIPTWKTAPALAYGNTVVLKLAQDSPLTGLHLVRALEEAELPEGVLNVVIGRGTEVGEPLVSDPRVRGDLVHGLGAGRTRRARRRRPRSASACNSSSAATTR